MRGLPVRCVHHPLLILGVLLLFSASSLYFHFRGRLRFKLVRQLGDYSTLLAPYNAFACLATAGGSRPVHELGRYPELQLLRDNWQTIRDEALALDAQGQVRRAERQDRSEEHTSELQSLRHLVCRLL